MEMILLTYNIGGELGCVSGRGCTFLFEQHATVDRYRENPILVLICFSGARRKFKTVSKHVLDSWVSLFLKGSRALK